MNNIVDILYNKRERHPQISINGEKISRYMELADMIYDDIYNWADKLYESMDDELCESYTIRLTGHPFHHMLLKSLQHKSQYCTEVSFTPVTHSIPVTDKLAYARELNTRYCMGVQQQVDNICFFSNEPERFKNLVPCTAEPGNYYITTGTQLPEGSVKCCIMLAEKMSYEKVRGIPVVHTPLHLLPYVVEYLNLYHLHLDFIHAVFSAAGDLNMTEDEKLKYEAYVQEEYRIRVDSLPRVMNTGERFRVTYTYYPQQFGDPRITISTGNSAVLFAADNTLVAQSAGTADVILTDKSGTVRGSYTITVEHHNYVSDISIILPATSVCINETMRFKCLISPNDAEDIANVRYTVSDTTVAAFSGQNEIYGIAAGRVKVTVSTTRVSKSFYLTVLPHAKDVILPEEVLAMPINADAYIDCSVVPPNASPMPTVTWQSSNPYIVKVVETRGFSCRVASGFQTGTAVLKCSLNGTDISRCMRINVEKAKGCYVATAVYGSYDCPQVWALRRYRDMFLEKHILGRAFIKLYYAVSPTAVKWFGETKWFNRLWRGILDNKVRKLKQRGYEDTPYND